MVNYLAMKSFNIDKSQEFQALILDNQSFQSPKFGFTNRKTYFEHCIGPYFQ